MERKTILGIFSHPDDESMGPGGTFAKYAAMGHRVAFVTATEGGAGRLYEERPEDQSVLRAVRREETRAAAEVLGVEFLGFLGLPDGGLRREDVLDLEERLVEYIRRVKPDVVITFHGSGISYHPDHRVVTLATWGAFHGAASSTWYRSDVLRELPPHRPSRLYHFAPPMADYDWPKDVYTAPPEEVTTLIDTKAWADMRWRAIEAHDSQRNGPPFRRLYEAGAFDVEAFVRMVPTWTPGVDPETDLLAGL